MTIEDLRELLENRLAASRRPYEEICAEAGVGRSTVYRWLQGEGLVHVAKYLSFLEACGCEFRIVQCPGSGTKRPGSGTVRPRRP